MNTPTPIKILVVDDDDMVRFLYTRFLQKTYNVDCATSGQHALELITSMPPTTYAAILTDNTMPGMKGTDLIATLRTRGYTTPIVLNTGDDLEGIYTLPKINQPTALLEKPVEKTTLLDVLAHVIANSQPKP